MWNETIETVPMRRNSQSLPSIIHSSFLYKIYVYILRQNFSELAQFRQVISSFRWHGNGRRKSNTNSIRS